MALKSQNLHKSNTKSIEKAIKNTINPIQAWGSFGHPFIGWIFSVKFF